MSDQVPIEFLLHLHGLDDDPVDLSKSIDEAPDPAALFIEKTQFDRAMGKATDDDWDAEIGGGALRKASTEVAAGPIHADGEEIEEIAQQVWRWRYQDNKLVSAELRDPELADGVMYFDENGNEKAA